MKVEIVRSDGAVEIVEGVQHWQREENVVVLECPDGRDYVVSLHGIAWVKINTP